MDSLIETFHLDIKLIIAQFINFGIVFCVLYFFGLKPLFKAISERSDKIAKSLAEGEEIKRKLSQTQEDYQKEISRAKKEAGQILEKAGALAEEQKKEMVIRAKQEIRQAIDQEKEKISAEKIETLRAIKAEVADLVIASVEKILGEKATVKMDKEFIVKTINKE